MPARPVINQLWFPECHFSSNGISLCLGEVQMKIYETLLQALFSSAPHGFAARLCLLAQLALPAQIGELACRLCINGSDKFETGQNKGLFSDNKDNQLLTYWYEPQLASLWPTAIWFQHFVRHFKSIGLKNRGKIRPQGHYNLVNLVPC